MLYKTTAEDAHVHSLAPLLSRADQMEIEAFSGMTPLEGLAYSKASSPVCYTIMEDETPVAMYGGAPHGDGRANVWLLTSDRVANHSTKFLRQCLPNIDQLHEELGSSLIYAFADPRNRFHMKWLRFAGFRFGDIVRFRNNPFITVTRLKCVA